MSSLVKTHVVERLAFHPPTPPTYETTDDLVVAGSTYISHFNPGLCLSEDGKDVVVVYSHGNAEDLGACAQRLAVFAKHWNVELVAYDYTGYGPFQTQSPSEEACYGNMADVIEYLEAEGVGTDKIVLMGRSLGSGPTCHAASLATYAGVVLVSPFTSAARTKLPWLLCPESIDIFNNLTKISSVYAPLLVIHGNQDRVVPYAHGVQLFDAAPKSRTFLKVEDAGHNDLLQNGTRVATFLEAIGTFLDSLETT